MTNIIIFSQNVVLSEESFKHIKNKNIETYILTTNSLFDNEKRLIKDFFKYSFFVDFEDYLTDEEMSQIDENAFRGADRPYEEYILEIRKLKNKLVADKITKDRNYNGYLFSSNNDLGIVDEVWVKKGFVKCNVNFYYNSDSSKQSAVSIAKSFIKNILKKTFIYDIYKKKRNLLTIEDVRVAVKDNHKFILIGKPNRIDYRIDIPFEKSSEDLKNLNSGIYEKKEACTYLVPWHEYPKCHVPDSDEYDVQWVQDGYLPSNYSDYTYSFKPNNVRYSVWDAMGAKLFINKNLPYCSMPYRKKLYLPKAKFNTKISRVLIATSASGDWTALKNRSDDDYLVKAIVEVAKRYPQIMFVYRCHPNWICSDTLGTNSINRLSNYFNELNLDNLKISGNIPDGKSTRTFSRSSLEEDLKAADIVFGEHSVSMIDGGFMGIPFCSINMSNRRNFFQNMNDLGFPSCNTVDDICNLLDSYTHPGFQEKYQNAINNYNNMTDIDYF